MQNEGRERNMIIGRPAVNRNEWRSVMEHNDAWRKVQLFDVEKKKKEKKGGGGKERELSRYTKNEEK